MSLITFGKSVSLSKNESWLKNSSEFFCFKNAVRLNTLHRTNEYLSLKFSQIGLNPKPTG